MKGRGTHAWFFLFHSSAGHDFSRAVNAAPTEQAAWRSFRWRSSHRRGTPVFA